MHNTSVSVHHQVLAERTYWVPGISCKCSQSDVMWGYRGSGPTTV